MGSEVLYLSRADVQEVDLPMEEIIPAMEYYRSIGYFAEIPKAPGDLGELVTGKKPARTNAKQRTMSM